MHIIFQSPVFVIGLVVWCSSGTMGCCVPFPSMCNEWANYWCLVIHTAMTSVLQWKLRITFYCQTGHKCLNMLKPGLCSSAGWSSPGGILQLEGGGYTANRWDVQCAYQWTSQGQQSQEGLQLVQWRKHASNQKGPCKKGISTDFFSILEVC